MQKRTMLLAISIIAVAVVVILVVASMGLWGPEEVDRESAIVAFELDDGTSLNIDCEVADTHQEREVGLSGREELANGSGMLFVFDPPRAVSFWMKDTWIPLDIVFVDVNGTVVGYAEADPEPMVPTNELRRYSSTVPVVYVVEMNQGTCAANGIGPGTNVTVTYLD